MRPTCPHCGRRTIRQDHRTPRPGRYRCGHPNCDWTGNTRTLAEAEA